MEYTAKPAVGADGRVAGKFLGMVMLTVAGALLLSCLAALGVSAVFASLYGTEYGLSAEGAIILGYLLMGSTVAVLVYNLIASFTLLRKGKGYLLSLIVFSLWVGIILSSLLLAGLSFEVAAEGLGITALAFFAMFLVGYFTKVNAGILSMLGLGLLFGALAISIVGLISFLLEAFSWYDVLVQGIILVAVLLFTAADSRNMRRLASTGMVNANLVFACAYTLYGDFINILLRILYFLLLTRSNN